MLVAAKDHCAHVVQACRLHADAPPAIAALEHHQIRVAHGTHTLRLGQLELSKERVDERAAVLSVGVVRVEVKGTELQPCVEALAAHIQQPVTKAHRKLVCGHRARSTVASVIEAAALLLMCWEHEQVLHHWVEAHRSRHLRSCLGEY
eukprot:1262712-Prymnesium_polylepis.1